MIAFDLFLKDFKERNQLTEDDRFMYDFLGSSVTRVIPKGNDTWLLKFDNGQKLRIKIQSITYEDAPKNN